MGAYDVPWSMDFFILMKVYLLKVEKNIALNYIYIYIFGDEIDANVFP